MREPHGLQQSAQELVATAADVLERVRGRSPRVHCITNSVAQAFTANVLLAFGARPSMTLSGEEIGAFVAASDALLVNLGTFDAERRAATETALDAAEDEGLPWVLDPVLIDRSPMRAAYAKALLVRAPQAVRLNGSEFAALAGAAPEPGAVQHAAREASTVIGLTGKVDLVTDGTRLVTLENGDALMDRVTGMGCVASALVAACLAVEGDALAASVAALLGLGISGEVAAERANGPGSFAAAILDALHRLDRETLIARARVQ